MQRHQRVAMATDAAGTRAARSASDNAPSSSLPTSFAASSPGIVAYVVFVFCFRVWFWIARSPASRGFSISLPSSPIRQHPKSNSNQSQQSL